MFLEERPVLHVYKVKSKALGRQVERRYRKAPDLTWKKDILSRAQSNRIQDIIHSAPALDDSVDIDELCDGLDQMHLPEDFQYDEDQAWEVEHEMEFLRLGQVEDDLDELSQDEDAYSMEL